MTAGGPLGCGPIVFSGMVCSVGRGGLTLAGGALCGGFLVPLSLTVVVGTCKIQQMDIVLMKDKSNATST